jgi:C1A family cysteine protease
VAALPSSVDLRAKMPPVWDQFGQGACVAHATGAAFAYDLIVKGDPPLMPARDFIYYNARDIEGTTDQDAGCEPRDALNAINGLGVPDESLWAYSDADLLAKPGLEVYQDATAHASIVYNAVDQSSEGLRAALASGLPVIIGIQAYASLESDAVAASGIIPMPATNEECLSGHSMLLAGYQTNADNSISYITRNSWGPEWGQAGYCIIQEAYLLNPTLCSDLWCLQSCN